MCQLHYTLLNGVDAFLRVLGQKSKLNSKDDEQIRSSNPRATLFAFWGGAAFEVEGHLGLSSEYLHRQEAK